MKYISFIFFIFITHFCFSEEKIVKKIVSDITEYDKKENKINFYGNVKILLSNGYITCDEAFYDKKREFIKCISRVYTVLTSTKEGTKVEITSSYVDYNIGGKQITFTQRPFTVYTSSDNKILAELYSDKILFDEKNDTIFCEGNIEMITQEGKLFCSTAKYILEDGIIKINYTSEKLSSENRLNFISSKKGLKLDWFVANTGIINFKNNKLELYGKVEMIFKI